MVSCSPVLIVQFFDTVYNFMMKISFVAAIFALHLVFFYCNAGNILKVPLGLENYIGNSKKLDKSATLISKLNGIFAKGVIPSYLSNLLSNIEQNSLLEDSLFANVSQPCRAHTSAWIQSLLENFALESNTWALQMIDAWPKIPEGILSGHTTVLGDFDECVGVRANLKPAEKQEADFKGLYCTSFVIMLDPSATPAEISTLGNQPREAVDLEDFLANHLYGTVGAMQTSLPVIGSCYPSTCSNEDVSLLLMNTFREFVPVIGPYVLPIINYCTTDDAPELNGGDIAMISVLAVVLALCLTSTAVDLMLDPCSLARNGYASQALLAFSVYTNTKKWLNTKSGGGAGGGENFSAMHGIRFLSTCWVVLAHTWAVTSFMSTWNNVDTKRLYDDNWTIFSVLNGTVSVDTFFAMSGLLFAYNMLKVLQKSKGRINVPMMYLHRYLRLTPTYALLVGIVATVYGHLGNGPLWAQVATMSNSCRKNWWHNLLYINNFIFYIGGDDGMCHGESWYLADDIQFFLVSPLLIYPLFKWETVGMILLALASVASVAIPWIIHATQEPTLLPTLMFAQKGTFVEDSYMKPWMRFGPYAVGLWAGFLLYKTANKKLNIPKLAILAAWTISTVMALSIIFGIIPWFNPATEIPKGTAAFYAGAHRFAWGIVICWIIFACTRGYGGPVACFLSVDDSVADLRFSLPESSTKGNPADRLILFCLGRLRQPTTYDPYVSTNLFFAHLVISLLVGFICCITMESPFIVLEKLLFQGPTKVKEPTKPTVGVGTNTDKSKA